jgi:hypothetical protein
MASSPHGALFKATFARFGGSGFPHRGGLRLGSGTRQRRYGSVATTCDTLSDATGTVYRASANVRGRDVVAVCIAPGGNVPATCERVLSVARSK